MKVPRRRKIKLTACMAGTSSLENEAKVRLRRPIPLKRERRTKVKSPDTETPVKHTAAY